MVGLVVGLGSLMGCMGVKAPATLPVPASNAEVFKPEKAPLARVSATYGKLPLSFEANQGQTDSQVKFLSRGRGYTLFLTSDEAVLVSNNPSAVSDQLSAKDRNPTVSNFQSEIQSQRPAREQVSINRGKQSTVSHQTVSKMEQTIRAATGVVRMKLFGANSQAQVVGVKELPGKSNYFIGNDPRKWRTNIPTYGKVKYKDVYPGIDLIYYGNQRQLEFDFVVAPGGDPTAIKFEFDSTDEVEINETGSLVLHSSAGPIYMRKPVVYQKLDGARKEIRAGYVLFEVEDNESQGLGQNSEIKELTTQQV